MENNAQHEQHWKNLGFLFRRDGINNKKMIVRKVAFEKTIGMPNYSNDRPIVVEADLEPGETKEEAWTRINQDMIAWHRREYPNLYQQEPSLTDKAFSHSSSVPTISANTAPIEINLQHEKIEIDIDNATTLEDLQKIKDSHPLMTVPLMTLW